MHSIVHVLGSMDFGGAEITTINLMEKLNNEFDQVYFFTTSGRKGEFSPALEEKGFKVYTYSIYHIMFAYKFISFLKEKNISVVHSHISLTSGFIMFLGKLAGVERRITHFRSAKENNTKHFFSKLKIIILRYLISKFSTNIVSVSQSAMATNFPKYKSDLRCSILYNGKESLYQEEPKYFEEYDIYKKIIIHVGRFHESKNHIKIIDVFNELLKIEPDTLLLLIGNNDTEIGDLIKNRILELGIENNIKILGIKKNISDYLAVSDVFLFPSLWEGLPGALLEALSAGLPVLCSDIDPHKEVYNNMEGVQLLSTDLSDEIWAENLIRLSNIGKSEKLAMQFKKSPYYIEISIDKFKNLYNSELP